MLGKMKNNKNSQTDGGVNLFNYSGQVFGSI